MTEFQSAEAVNFVTVLLNRRLAQQGKTAKQAKKREHETELVDLVEKRRACKINFHRSTQISSQRMLSSSTMGNARIEMCILD